MVDSILMIVGILFSVLKKGRWIISTQPAANPGMIGVVASRIAGSQDIFAEPGQRPINGINFVTCHDGFTLRDLVSYNDKHNLSNGEDNRDGSTYNASWNHGVEGETEDPAINALRRQQVKNFFTILLLSQGVPMLLAGDEVYRTQHGNNNAYCQDNEVSWFDWHLLEEHADLLRFVKGLIAFRHQQPALRRESFFSGLPDRHGQRDISWHGTQLQEPAWNDPEARTLAFTITDGATTIHVMLNMDFSDQCFDIPLLTANANWKKIIDTAQPSPFDIVASDQASNIDSDQLLVAKHSIVALLSNRHVP